MKDKLPRWSARDILDECCHCQRQLTDIYNTAAGQATNRELRQDWLEILDQEHQLLSDLGQVVERRGMHQPLPAGKEDISQIQDLYSS